jgi:hypothetical protein
MEILEAFDLAGTLRGAASCSGARADPRRRRASAAGWDGLCGLGAHHAPSGGGREATLAGRAQAPDAAVGDRVRVVDAVGLRRRARVSGHVRRQRPIDKNQTVVCSAVRPATGSVSLSSTTIDPDQAGDAACAVAASPHSTTSASVVATRHRNRWSLANRPGPCGPASARPGRSARFAAITHTTHAPASPPAPPRCSAVLTGAATGQDLRANPCR